MVVYYLVYVKCRVQCPTLGNMYKLKFPEKRPPVVKIQQG